jgi:L-lactate dehydrogenase
VQGYRGIEDVYLSLPTIVNRSGIRDVLKVELSPDEDKALQRSAAALKAAISEIGLYEKAALT